MVEVLKGVVTKPESKPIWQFIALLIAIAISIAVGTAFGLSILGVGLLLLTLGIMYMFSRLVPDEYRPAYYFIVIAIGVILVGLAYKGIIPLSCIAVIGGAYASLLEATLVNVLVILWAMGAVVALVLLYMGKKLKLPSLKTRRIAKTVTA